MNEVIAWATFAGAWLLVAGPLYQGTIELRELDVDREGIQDKIGSFAAAQAPPSAWWWLVPPVMYVLRRRWNQAMRKAMKTQLTAAQREQINTFQSKASGWFTVAGGAALLAAGETWTVVRHYHWPVWLFWLLVTAMAVLSVLNTAIRMIHSAPDRDAAGLEAAPAPAAEQL